MSNLFGNLLIKEMAIVVLCSGYTRNRHPPPPIQSISSAFTDEEVNVLNVQRLFYQFEHARHFLTSITVSKMLVTDNFKEKMFKDQNA